MASIYIHLIGKDAACVIKSATTVEDQTVTKGELVLKDENSKVVGKFTAAQVAGWWVGE